MAEIKDLSITIVHSLPGRLRCRLSHSPLNWQTMHAAIVRHEGIHSLTYTAVSRSILFVHDQDVISSEELIIRLAVVFSNEYRSSPVRLLASPQREEITGFSVFAGVVLAAAALSRFVPSFAWARSYGDLASGISTAAAVVGHGFKEVQETGKFDPEVLSVVYLVYSLIQGRGLAASMITWIATFGRHLLTPPIEGVLLNIKSITGDDPHNPSFELAARPDHQQPRLYTFLKYARTALADLLSGGSLAKDQLIGRIREVTDAHDSLLEGIGKYKSAIHIHID